jgi:hypothetical protein
MDFFRNSFSGPTLPSSVAAPEPGFQITFLKGSGSSLHCVYCFFQVNNCPDEILWCRHSSVGSAVSLKSYSTIDLFNSGVYFLYFMTESLLPLGGK